MMVQGKKDMEEFAVYISDFLKIEKMKIRKTGVRTVSPHQAVKGLGPL